MAKKKKKSKLRKKIRKWTILTLVLLFFLSIAWGIVELFLLVSRTVSGWFKEEPRSEMVEDEVVEASAEELMSDSLLAIKLDKLLKQNSQHLDTTRMSMCVFDATTQREVFNFHPNRRLIPASIMKVPTAIAALEMLGMEHAYKTSVKMRGKMSGDTLVGTVVLNGDDDPLLLTLDTLANGLRRKGISAVRGHLTYKMTREDLLSSHPSTKSWDIPYHRTPMMLRGKQYVKSQWKAALKKAGITFEEDQSVHTSGEWTDVAETSTPLKDVLAPMLIHSSNIKAEAVFFHLDNNTGRIRQNIMKWDNRQHAVDLFWRRYFNKRRNVTLRGAVWVDGSGLSPLNRITSHQMIEILRYSWRKEHIRNYFIETALATPGHPTRHGSLLGRMSSPKYKDRVFVKTGTMVTEGTSSLTGYIHAGDGHWYLFCIINNNAPVAESRLFQDLLCKTFIEHSL